MSVYVGCSVPEILATHDHASIEVSVGTTGRYVAIGGHWGLEDFRIALANGRSFRIVFASATSAARALVDWRSDGARLFERILRSGDVHEVRTSGEVSMTTVLAEGREMWAEPAIVAERVKIKGLTDRSTYTPGVLGWTEPDDDGLSYPIAWAPDLFVRGYQWAPLKIASPHLGRRWEDRGIGFAGQQHVVLRPTPPKPPTEQVPWHLSGGRRTPDGGLIKAVQWHSGEITGTAVTLTVKPSAPFGATHIRIGPDDTVEVQIEETP